MKEKYLDYEEELDFKDLLITILEHWRRILLAGIVLALFFGGISFYSGFRKMNDAAYMSGVRENYTKAKADYAEAKQICDKQIRELREEIEKQNRYLTGTLKMRLDPYHIYKGAAVYYVSTDYQIMPGMTYQNFDTASAILNSYRVYLSSLDYKSEIPEEILRNGYVSRQFTIDSAQDMTSESLEQADAFYASENLLAQAAIISVDTDSHTLMITAMGDSEELVSALLAAGDKAIHKFRPEVVKNIGLHTIDRISSNQIITVDSMLANEQKDVAANITVMTKNIQDITTQRDKMAAPVNIVPSGNSVRKSALKFAVAGGILGMLAACAWLMIAYMGGGRLHTVEELKKRYGAVVLGVIPVPVRGGICAFIDRWIQGLRDGEKVSGSREKLFEVAAANASASVGNAGNILVVGSIEKTVLDETGARFAQYMKEGTVLTGGDITSDPEAVRRLESADAVILVEQRNHSFNRNIEQELDILKSRSLKIVGFVLL